MATKEKKKQKSFGLVSDNWIEKSNALNEVRNNRMTISQIRLFSIYLSKINPRDEKTREVKFKLDEYAKIMQFNQVNTTQLEKTADNLLGLTVKYFDKTGEHNNDGIIGFVACQIFKRFRLYKNDGEWYISIDCHDDVLHLMFDLQKYYFTYELWNALQLTSPNQQRMYEILKQYEKIGERIVTVKDLREWLGIGPKEYSQWTNFKIRVLDASQEALARYTDIKFTWEIAGKRGKGGKINALKFKIEKNYDYERQYTLDDYLIEQKAEYEDEPGEFVRSYEEDDIDTAVYDPQYIERIKYLSEVFRNEFNFNDIVALDNKMVEVQSVDIWLKPENKEYCFNYFEERYFHMQRYYPHNKKDYPSRLDYIKLIIGYSIPYLEIIEAIKEACNNEFTFLEAEVIDSKLIELIPHSRERNYLYHYTNQRYKYMDLQSKRQSITHRFKYLLSILGTGI